MVGQRRECRRGLELWPPVREAGTARSPVPHLARLTPEVVAALRNRTRVVRRISLEWFRHRTGGQKNGRHREGGHFGSALCGCLRLYGRPLACNTLALSAGHLHPGIGPANIDVKRLTCCIGPFTEVSRRYGRIAKNGDFQFGVAGPFHCLQFGQRLDPASYFPICACDRAALPSRSTPIKHHIHVLFIAILFIVEIFERIWPEPGK